MKNLFRVLFLVALLVPCLVACAQTTGNSGSIPVKEFKEAVDGKKGVLIDVRTPEECAEGIIAGATMLNYSAPGFMDRIKTMDRNTPVYLYCASGGRSHQTMVRMTALGFKEVHDLEGGTVAWREAGQPLVTVGSGAKR